tara:strand:+ start:1390 stop:1620 length:231 start_codon:yes stop_codon:yes gene_type:complete
MIQLPGYNVTTVEILAVWCRLGDEPTLEEGNVMQRFWDFELDITRDRFIANRCNPGPSGRRHWEIIGRKLDRKLRR